MVGRHHATGLLVLAGISVAALLWLYAGRAFNHTGRTSSSQTGSRPAAIVWDGRVFSSRARLASWLAAHGTRYPAWAKLHPVDAAIVEHRAGPLPGALKPPPRSATRPGSTGSSVSGAWARVALLCLAAIIMLAAAVPSALVRVLGPDWLSVTRRTYVFALGLSICLGALVAGGRL